MAVESGCPFMRNTGSRVRTPASIRRGLARPIAREYDELRPSFSPPPPFHRDLALQDEERPRVPAFAQVEAHAECVGWRR